MRRRSIALHAQSSASDSPDERQTPMLYEGIVVDDYYGRRACNRSGGFFRRGEHRCRSNSRQRECGRGTNIRKKSHRALHPIASPRGLAACVTARQWIVLVKPLGPARFTSLFATICDSSL